jgi:predicted small lipoprotein YifL
MISQILTLANDNKGVTTLITALTVVALLGGTGTITLPADHKVAELETQVAQTLEQIDDRFQQQGIEMKADEVERIRWQIQDLNRAIKQFDDDPDYQELLREERRLLMERQEDIMSDLFNEGKG